MGASKPDGTYWNGKLVKAVRCVVVLGQPDLQQSPLHWARDHVGEERRAVEVWSDGACFHIDDEGYQRSPEEEEFLRERVRAWNATDAGGRMPMAEPGDDPQVGGLGWGWWKVTHGRGMPNCGHASVPVERVVRYLNDDGTERA